MKRKIIFSPVVPVESVGDISSELSRSNALSLIELQNEISTELSRDIESDVEAVVANYDRRLKLKYRVT
jgi:hypothetical protein